MQENDSRLISIQLPAESETRYIIVDTDTPHTFKFVVCARLLTGYDHSCDILNLIRHGQFTDKY